MSWFSSWVPSLPSLNFTIPANIQSRFLSFVLKRSLGHLFKPGQLDSAQIDSQLGSGHIQVNDLELDELAINGYLQTTPLMLEAGSVQSITIGIGSTIRLSAKSLHLKLRVNTVTRRAHNHEVNLTDSVASVAETFVHDELTDQEEAGLRGSIHSMPHMGNDDNVPGGLDPFTSTEEELLMDPAGVSLFASLIEKILARLECDAQDIQISITDASNVTLRFCLAEFSTATDAITNLSGIKRTLTLRGIELFGRNHVRISGPASSPTTRPTSPSKPGSWSSGSGSRRSSRSSMDEEAELQMSRSIAMLPPRSVSPADSTASSIYHSIVETSAVVTSTPPRPAEVPQESLDAAEDRFVSIGASSIHLITPAPGEASTTRGVHRDRYRVEVQLGVLAVAIQPWQILGIGQLAEKLAVGTQPPHTSQKQSHRHSPSPSWSFDLDLELRGVCVLLSSSVGDPSAMAEYFSHPLTPPPLSTGYTRLLIDTGSCHASLSSTFEDITCEAAVSDISVFQFLPRTPVSDEDIAPSRPQAIPILIADPLLSHQYDSDHAHPTEGNPFNTPCPQPTLQVLDWRNPKYFTHGHKVATWRHRPRPRHTHARIAPKENEASRGPCLTASFHRSPSSRSKRSPRTDQHAQLEMIPLHFFVDLELFQLHGGILCFAQDLSLEQSMYTHTFPPRPPTPESDRDPWLSSDDDEIVDVPSPRAQVAEKDENVKMDSQLYAVLTMAMIRLSILVPPPPGRPRRSGILVIDLHNISISNSHPPGPPQQVQFGPSGYRLPHEPGNILGQVQCQRIVVGCSPASEASALAVLSVGPLIDNSESGSLSLPPVIKLSKPEAGQGGSETTISINVPSIYLSISKEQWDNLQYWIDDLTQAMERMGSAAKELAESRDSRNASIIGSRYFTRSHRSSTCDSSKSFESGVTLAISVGVTELSVRLDIPRLSPEGGEIRPFHIRGSDFNAHVELHAGGKLSTVVTFMDALVRDTDRSGESVTFLSLTSARSLTSIPRPLIKVRFISQVIPGTTAKESKVSVSLSNFTLNAYPDIQWMPDLIAFTKAPPGTFEAVVPTERACISVKIVDGSVRAFAPTHPGALVLSVGGLHFATDIIGDARDSSFRLDIASLAALAIDDIHDAEQLRVRKGEIDSGMAHWKAQGYALLAEISSTKLHYHDSADSSPEKQVLIDGIKLHIHACADTLASVGAFGGDLASHFKGEEAGEITTPREIEPALLSPAPRDSSNLTGSIDELAFKRAPEIGPTPDMIYDDLPTNLDYLDESFGAAAGLRELTDDDLDEFDIRDIATPSVPVASAGTGIISSVGGETIRVLRPEGLNIVEGYYDDLPRETVEERPTSEGEAFRVRVRNCDITLLLYDGYDWPRTRRTIEEEVKEMRKRLAKIRQLVASGQTQEPISDDTSALLFNSVYIGLNEDVDVNEPDALIAAIDDELRDDFETGTQSSWQTVQQPGSSATAAARGPGVRVHGKKLTRSRGPSMEFRLSGLNAEVNNYGENSVVVSRTFATVRDLEILDHIKTSTWKKFLTALRSDSKGNIRETGANMVRIELHSVRPSLGSTSEEARLRAKLLPLRLYVDQDAVDFLKKFFSFQDPNATPNPTPGSPPQQEAYIQMAEIFPIDLKLDYKPRRVDYRALREGKTIELMNFFHFDGAEMTLRHITLSGVTGWAKMFEMLNDLWTPDVKATQLVDVISGVAPIRSVVNVGSGVADLVLLPISQYRKDGRIVRGVQKGATAFVKSTALEAIKLGARLATGTQVILEQTEGILGGEFDKTITTEALQQQTFGDEFTLPSEEFDEDAEHISKYAQQPADIKEGVQSAYKSLSRNLNSAAQTILAVPMEVYERSGNEGPVRSVIRAVPIAILKPMIGATEAVSKTLLGLHNTLDPEVRLENEAKYKNR
ncbi:hypothetical protein FA13DRAFT_1683755 [Coprinellus micaceus]|uniref:Autophagy-related protein 2 n=1 Tax=Coprinellus micaceus TaxID=71717 RepID=A0A4Y7TQC3_COPMI|nr:hypothetical protein FA13DRAFT_1683755 [Coprinellus micaceus]